MFNELLTFIEKYNHIDVPPNYTTKSGRKLKRWIVQQKYKIKISRLRKDRLEKIKEIFDKYA